MLMNLMNHHLKAKIHESLAAVLPVTMIVLILSMTVTPMSLSTLMMFLTGAFGIVAMVAMSPLIIIQLIGLIYKVKTSRRGSAAVVAEDEVILLDVGWNRPEAAVS